MPTKQKIAVFALLDENPVHKLGTTRSRIRAQRYKEFIDLVTS